MTIRRGDIYFVRVADLDIAGHEQQKNRPYLIVSRDSVNAAGTHVMGVPLTTKTHKVGPARPRIEPQDVTLESGAQFRLEPSLILTDHMRVLDPRRFHLPRMGFVLPRKMSEVELALAYLLSLP
ncbi:MAG: type II toxin-antitoxin system PemK/MazF family toxin [Acidobacteria bacterium]|nr:type II toxin-antitoxin system PemK/MazF family toxin [Acidobacteriota bacterium]